MENWLSDNWWYVGTLFAFAVWHNFEVRSMRKELDSHLDPKNEAPHPACPVHDVKFNQVVSDLSEIKKTISTLDKRIFAFMKINGHSMKIEEDEI